MAPVTDRFEAVFIRKSSEAQDEVGQCDNVRAMLKEKGKVVANEYWFVGTVSRRKVKSDPEFKRLMDLVEAGKISTVYVESQDRWGTADIGELFTLLGNLRRHDTQLYDLRAKMDLTAGDLPTKLLAFMNSIKSEKELQDLSYRSLRTRVSNFKETGSWPTGPHPFGYGKACYTAAGKLRWVWQPHSRTEGQLYYPDGENPGCLRIAGPVGKILRKEKGQRELTVLVPSNNPAHVESVRMVFDLYARVGLSRRQISKRLNDDGRRFYHRHFTHSFVTQILTNPAYVGDTHFGKTQTGELHTFDADGLIVTVKNGKAGGNRDLTRRIIKQGTHEPLIDRKTWDLAQAKLASENSRTSYSPRNPNYYLKQLLVCGHCGKGMTARTEIDRKTRKATVVYVCASYVAGRCNGHAVDCGCHRITHADAEQLLLDKMAERDLRLEDSASVCTRADLQKRLIELGDEDDESREKWLDLVQEGIKALLEYMKQSFEMDAKSLRRLQTAAMAFYRWGRLRPDQASGLPIAIDKFRDAIRDAEQLQVEHAKTKVAQLDDELKKYTKAWALASPEQATILKAEAKRVESELNEWRPLAAPLSVRIKKLCDAEDARLAEYDQLCKGWPVLGGREKGEVLRRLFTTVTLYWDRTFRPAEAKPSRPRKTTRPGRYSYRLRTDRIEWAFAKSDLAGSW